MLDEQYEKLERYWQLLNYWWLDDWINKHYWTKLTDLVKDVATSPLSITLGLLEGLGSIYLSVAGTVTVPIGTGFLFGGGVLIGGGISLVAGALAFMTLAEAWELYEIENYWTAVGGQKGTGVREQLNTLGTLELLSIKEGLDSFIHDVGAERGYLESSVWEIKTWKQWHLDNIANIDDPESYYGEIDGENNNLPNVPNEYIRAYPLAEFEESIFKLMSHLNSKYACTSGPDTIIPVCKIPQKEVARRWYITAYNALCLVQSIRSMHEQLSYITME